MRRRVLVGAVGAVVCALLTACGGLSTSSTVRPGLEVGSAPENEVKVEANPVAPGSTPVQVVNGFIRAAAASDDQYQVARSFLGPRQASSWRPDNSVVVFTSSDQVEIKATGPDTVTAVVTATARIDGDGRYHELPDNTTMQASFGVGKLDGEWRITQLPEGFGSWLSSADLERLYDPFRIYFLSAVERQLVPDIRWFPLGTGLATRLARALLAGVPAYLNGAVRTDVPAGTRLAVDAVTIDSGIARVDLSTKGLGSDPERRQNLAAQFYNTVTQAPGVDRVALELEGADLQVPGAPREIDSLASLGFGARPDPTGRPLLRTGTSLTVIDKDQLSDPDRRPASQRSDDLPTLQLGWAFPALSAAGNELAAVSGDRQQLSRWRGREQVQVIGPGSLLTQPTYDRLAVLWFSGVTGGRTAMWAINTAGDSADTQRPVTVKASWLTGRRIVAQKVSPDGQRLAVVSTDPQGKSPRLQVAGIQREASGVPASLAEPLTLAPSLSLMRDVVWVDETELAVLGRKTSAQVVRPWFVPLGGPISAGPELAGAQAITTVNGERGLVATTDQHQVLLRAGNRWQRIGAATDLIVPAGALP
ncbi:LpqB family beta-propeller domain-containing protein [Knoellia koreensis]|uniref:GerMN domain-containing protein n=1 Tax=Knoellia koreensis TaxID=2730921 RepID=A0A849HIE4_9MICO|nr:hypothetical protein [Knoellia sp. DB2414S]